MKARPRRRGAKRRRRAQEGVADVLRSAFRRLGEWERSARALQRKLADAHRAGAVRQSLDFTVHELETMRRTLAGWICPGCFPKAAAMPPARLPRSAAAKPAAFAARFATDCESWAHRLCGLMQTARSAGDAASERIAAVLLRTLEKLLWLLNPSPAEPFSSPSRFTLQLQSSVP